MTANPRLFYIGTSKAKEIRKGGEVIGYDWYSKGKWTNFKKPVPYKTTKVKYSAKTKNKIGVSKLGGLGKGTTILGSFIPATASRIINGVEKHDCEVRYYQRGYTEYVKSAALKKKKKMLKRTYTSKHPKQYQLQYRDKPIISAPYSDYVNGVDYIYFNEFYYNNGVEVPAKGHLMHPTDFKVKYSDVRRNLESQANNTDRDNSGTYVLTNVRANVVTLELAWEGLPPDEAADLLDSLNPPKDEGTAHNYLIVQYLDPASDKVVEKTFFASERSCEAMSCGWLKNITVTLTEV